MTESPSPRFVLCVANDGYPASLEPRKVYRQLPDLEAEKGGLIRVVDESGEDYLFPRGLFAPLELSSEVRDALARVG
jgi:hypothetical protein